ncbi:MAG TPA: hypothetical protein ENK18_20405 [Deltaproteobacteria bacterium]|nr:hypothetical protein [Deltaproteobacteria bacterium]
MRPDLIALLIALVTLAWPGRALAYPWMIEHQYTTCSQCHIDPSGGSAMTAYGRAQTEALLRSHYGKEIEDPGPVKDFLFGAVPLPDEVLAQADVRGLMIPRPGDLRFVLMQADLRGGLQNDSGILYASAGVVSEGASGARLLSDEGVTNEALIPVIRDYWVGLTPSNGVLIRLGRINLPFGIRTDQHILFTRSVTRTTTNDDQSFGLSASYEARSWRAEIMGIAGNLHVSPDAFRERGYSGTFAYALDNNAELGVSSLIAASKADVESLLPTTRQAHGVFTRYAPIEWMGILGEADLLLTSAGQDERTSATGAVVELHADVEAMQGLHLKLGGELCDPDLSDEAGSARRGWGAVQWFLAPHVNLRIDALLGPLSCTPGAEARPMGLAQLHAFL